MRVPLSILLGIILLSTVMGMHIYKYCMFSFIKKRAINVGYAEYNSTTGVFQYTDDNLKTILEKLK